MAAGGARLEFSSPSHDFDTLIQGDIVTHKYEFKNTGNRELKISKVSPSCGCTAGKLSRDRFRPGEKGILEITFNSDRFTDLQHKSVDVESNDSTSPIVKLTFTAYVKPIWHLEPGFVAFTGTEDGSAVKEKEVVVTLVNAHTKAMTFIDFSTAFDEISLDRPFPLTGTALKSGDTLTVRIRPALKSKIEESRYGHLDVKVAFEDGRKPEKRLGVALKKWR